MCEIEHMPLPLHNRPFFWTRPQRNAVKEKSKKYQRNRRLSQRNPHDAPRSATREPIASSIAEPIASSIAEPIASSIAEPIAS